MKIAFASSEVHPFAKTGGLGDVVGSLPIALSKLGHEVKVFMPKYAVVDHNKYDLTYCWATDEMPIRVAGKIWLVHVFCSTLPNSDVEIYFIDCKHFFNRPSIYTNDFDEDERFILFCKAVIESMQRLGWQPDIINCNDWQTGLIPLYIKDNYSWDQFFSRTATVFTIHNIGYQGRFPKETLYKAEIRKELWYPNSPVETWNSVNLMKTGLMFADALNTVSPTYAKETMTYEGSYGLDGTLHFRKDDYFGILNGADYSIWNPQTDKHIPHHYSVDDLSGKLACKKFLVEHVHLPFNENTPLIGIVARLTSQKGFDLFASSINDLMDIDAQWAILGTGEDDFEDLILGLHYSFPQKVFSYIGFNNDLAHLIEAASDIFLMPSRYEPCGLNQIYSMKYGTVPIVRKTGGLADTVHDWDEYSNLGQDIGTGFSFNDYSPYALVTTVQRAVSTFHNKKIWTKIIRNGMLRDYSWEVSACKYVELYEHALQKRRVT
jgi:starch synthase